MVADDLIGSKEARLQEWRNTVREEHQVGDFRRAQSSNATLNTLTDFRTVLSQTRSYIYPATTDIVQDNTEPGASIFGATNHYTDTYSVLETKEKGDAVSAGIFISNGPCFGQDSTVFGSGRPWPLLR
jgi:hypothetical protein